MASPDNAAGGRPGPAATAPGHRRALRVAVLVVLAAAVAAAGWWRLAQHPAAEPASPVLARGYRITADGQVRKVSTQWAGYAVRAGAPHTQASATWRLPVITCGHVNTNASFWAGLGGIRSTNVEQAGVQALCRSGHPVYAAWWQLFPAPAAPAGIDVHAGDLIAVTVANPTGTRVSITLADLTTGQRADLTRSTPTARLTSAEIIAEQSGDTIGPLSRFGTVAFTSARLDGHPLGQAGAYTVDMVGATGHVRAVPGPIISGSNFTVRTTSGT
jgi:Peptidase A4 family